MQRIYFDNAATTALREEVLAAMLPFLRQQYGNPSSIYAEGRAARAAVEKSRRNIARAIGAKPSELFFTSGGSEANNMAIKGAVAALGVKTIISTEIEHACVRNSVGQMQSAGVKSIDLAIDQFGRADLGQLRTLLAKAEGKVLVSLMHSNNELGTLNDIAAIAALCQEFGAYFHTDTVQTLGYYPIDVKQMAPIHFMSGSAHKLHGPKGVGFLYIRQGIHIPALIVGGGQERQLRSGTENVAGIVGFAKAVDLALAEMSEHRAHISALKSYLIEQLQTHFGERLSFNGDWQGESHYKVLSVNFQTEVPTDMLLFKLDLAGISASGGSACSSGALKGSRVLSALGLSDELRSLRLSFSYENTKEEIDRCIAALLKIV